MDLRTWRDSRPRGALASLAKAAGVQWQTLSDIAAGRRRAQVRTALLIEKHTDGEVSAEELLGIDPSRRRKRRRRKPASVAAPTPTEAA